MRINVYNVLTTKYQKGCAQVLEAIPILQSKCTLASQLQLSGNAIFVETVEIFHFFSVGHDMDLFQQTNRNKMMMSEP